jgi:TonB-dependent starch-binding outer membrane protein SusC
MRIPNSPDTPRVSMMGRKYLMISSFLLLLILTVMIPSAPVFAQKNIQVKGRITSESGIAVSKASVIVKGSSAGVTSDDNGNYEVTAPSNGTLIISYVGFTPAEIYINNRTSIDVSLSSTPNSLSQVIVVGYGTQKRSDVTGAIATVSGATLQEVPTANFVTELKGRTAGVDIVSNNSNPGATGQIRIRGNRSLAPEAVPYNPTRTAVSNDQLNGPLIVLDGIPYGGSINDINPDDIASLDILKDASSTAIYGSRGSGGVILITTKRGSKTGKSVTSYNGYYGFSNATDEYKVYNGAGYAALKAEAAAGNSINPGNSAYGLTTAETAGLTNGTSTDWQKLIYQTGQVTNQNISVNGGNERTQFSIGGSFYKEIGVIPGQDFTRFALRGTIDHQINSHLLIGINMMNSLSYTNYGGNPVGGLIRMSPLVSPYNADGTINALPQVGSIDGSVVNPLSIKYDAQAIVNNNRRLRTFNSLYGQWNIIEGLKYRLNVGLDYSQDQSGAYLGPNTFYNASTSLAAASETVGNAEAYTYTIENVLTYDKTIKEKNRINFTALYSVQQDHNQASGIFGTGIPADYIQNYNLSLATQVNASTATSNAAAVASNPWNFAERGLISYMARLNYAFDNRFLFTATVRTDGASVLSPGNQYYTYPAFALAWNMANEKFMDRVNWVSSLKLRGSWGITSNQGINPYSTLGALSTNAYNFGPGTAGQNIGYLVTSLANPNLKWQNTAQTDIGLDFSILKGRLTGTIDFYWQNTDNILLQESLPASNGAGSTTVNAGKTKGHGYEISLSSINIQSASGFTWSTDVNFSVDRDEIVQLQNPTLKQDIGNGWFVGQPITVIYDVKKIGIWQDKEAAEAATFGQKPGQIKVQDLNGDGKINASDAQILGNYQPDWIGGMTNRFYYKNFDFSFVMYARMGQMVDVPYITSDGSAQGFDFFNNGRNNQVKTNYWTPSNPTNGFPRPDASADKFIYASTLGYQDGSFVKMRSINLGYNLPSKWLGKSGISSLRVYATALNPFIIYSPLVKDGLALDPEGNGYGGAVNSSATATVSAPSRTITVNLNTPPTRQFNFGVNLKF